MEQLEELSNKQLKQKAKDLNLEGYENLPKKELIVLLQPYFKVEEPKKDCGCDDPKPIVLPKITPIKPKGALSSKAGQWKVYLSQKNLTAQEFLKLYPTHKDRVYIEELI